ncbi:MAG: uroporphyrinogen decarboxylase family protein [Spirochaetia bacterium]
MLPRERVEAALSFRTPDRIPLQIAPSPAGLYKHGQKLLDLARACGHDFGDAALMKLPDPPPAADFDPDGRYHALRTDQWGTTWEYRIFGIWGHPVAWPLNDLAALPSWHAPAPPPAAGPALEAALRAAQAHREQWYLIGEGGALFETLRWVRRFELIRMDIEDDTPEINRIAEIINDYNTALARHIVHLGCDAMSFGDDLGTQNALMISPAAFRRFFKPRYAELFAPVRNAGRGIFFHSCGQVTEVLSDLRDVGVTALWPQLPLYDLRELARRCRDLRIAVQLHPDRGELMQHGTPRQVRDYVLRLLDTFDTAHGGSWLFIEIDPGFPWENVEALFAVAMEVRDSR